MELCKAVCSVNVARLFLVGADVAFGCSRSFAFLAAAARRDSHPLVMLPLPVSVGFSDRGRCSE